jgi:hypothetical protein
MHITAQSESPQILQIFREALKSGSKDAYRRIEERTARLSAELGCPHPYLGIESLTASKEVWWLNGYTSAAERKQVVDDYSRNTRLLAALKENSQRKASPTGKAAEIFANYRPDLTVGVPWILGHGRFLVIAVMKSNRRINGTVFEATDGTRFVVMPARTRKEANAVAAAAGPRVERVRRSSIVELPSKRVGRRGQTVLAPELLARKGHQSISTGSRLPPPST